jgi:predicted molibdopterin-dependent oxidoreductase YjgC
MTSQLHPSSSDGRTPSTGTVTVTIDGAPVEVAAGTNLLDACSAAGVDTPTICYDPTLTPVNACRACVVEVEGSRTLVPSCSRRAEDGMVVGTDTERVRHSRRMVLELLASGVDLSQADDLTRWIGHYGADPDRYGPERATMDEPVRVQDDLYVRDYDRCVLCYKCVEACGDDAQRTFAIAVSGRGFGATIMIAGNIEGHTRTVPLAIYTSMQTPGEMASVWRLAALSVIVALAAMLLSEWLARRSGLAGARRRERPLP